MHGNAHVRFWTGGGRGNSLAYRTRRKRVARRRGGTLLDREPLAGASDCVPLSSLAEGSISRDLSGRVSIQQVQYITSGYEHRIGGRGVHCQPVHR
jgi:hypothetical protein